MTVRKILRMGDPHLLQRADLVPEVEWGGEALTRLVADMWDTLRAVGGAGLAAPQIGVGWRVVVFEVDHSRRYPWAEPVPATVLVNPSWWADPKEGWVGGWEGCLSLPSLRGWVERPARVHYRAVDEMGRVIRGVAEGFHARVLQHECDHLDGVLYPMRMRDLSRFGFVEELAAAGLIPPPRRD